ncbi:VPS10 domain-containing receptor SorCS1 [Nibea albiflora]|uniref:VPS10 domain-containing receptor SorCS1 n=1 Tax=Nibea albiflora TaxID=240163 RepID=A0ACB7FKF8_NIBAL|nr:VPS10 domain-containing receptor SorCS1 [Nibea albiflora]
MKRNTDDLQPQGENAEGEFAEMKVLKTSDGQKSSDGAGFTSRSRKRARRNSDDDDKVRSPGSARDPEPGEGMSSAAARRVTRSELRWSGEERRAAGPRQEELKLNSSTFALTGDSSHNQAMVHWSGQNSSVSDLLSTLSITGPYARIHTGREMCAYVGRQVRTHTSRASREEPNLCVMRRL